MIAGIGTDIAEVKRFERWVKNPDMLKRFFHEKEMSQAKSDSAKCQHYAVRFAAKEAFSKALGTGITGFNLKEVYITNNSEGAPLLNIEGAALSLMKERLGECKAFVSLSHEKDYAIAYVILEAAKE